VVRVTATDLAGTTAFDDFNLRINAANKAPAAVGDSVALLRDTSLVVAVRANDSDPDGDALIVSSVTQGANGGVVIDAATGSPRYTPNAGFIGDDTFSYTVSDGRGGQATATVSVLVASQLGDDGANTLTGGRGVDVIAGLAGADVISAGAGNDIVDGGDGNDTLRGGTGTDQIRGGTGDDAVQATGTELTGDTIDGGTGSDTLVFVGNVSLGSAGFTMVGVETLNMNGYSLSVQGTTALDLSALALINGGAIAGDSAGNRITGTQGNDNIDGGGGADFLKGGQGNDVIRGGSGADILVGGAGNDALYGGTKATGDKAADTFVFNSTLNGSTNVDTIYGFEANALDKIALDPAVFAAVFGNGTSGLDSGEFRANTGGNAVDANDYILYDSATGNLFYDADGSGAGAKVQFGALVGLIGALDSSDFTTSPPPGA
jgi:Ca2+-binding RTX toxin-like protein